MTAANVSPIIPDNRAAVKENLYEPHRFMIDSGTFWRCHHGSTGYYACWRCGLWHPIAFIKHLFEVKEVL